MDTIGVDSTSHITENPTPSDKKANKKKKQQQQSSGQQDILEPRLNPLGRAGGSEAEGRRAGIDEMKEDEDEEGQSGVTNGAPLSINGRGNQHCINGDNSHGEDGEDGKATNALRDELLGELKRTQELEQLVEILQKKLDQVLVSAATMMPEDLEREQAKSQELEKTVQMLKAQLLEKSAPAVKDVAIQDKVHELEEQSSAQRKEAVELRQLLGNEREFREKDRVEAEQRLEKVQEEKQQLDTQYKALLGRVAHIKATLSDKLKSDAEELDRTRNMVDNLEEENRALNQTINDLQADLEKITKQGDGASKELSTLRGRLNLSQQNWVKERNDLINAEKYTREEYENAKQAMQEWEIIATEERSVRESLGDRVIELEEQMANQQAAYDKVLLERNRESSTVDGLQRALQDIQNARKQELREIVESMEAQINQLSSKGQILEKRAKEAEAQLSSTQQDLQRVLPFEKEVKEKNLLIGKLRHEAVTLNDHLRKALRMLKRDNADDKIDKNLVTNVLLQFVSIQRGDSKKYEILQLIASVLDWNDEQREKAGLVRPGTAATSQNPFLKTPPLSPFHRSPSTPTLSDAYEGSRDLWTSVLDSERS